MLGAYWWRTPSGGFNLGDEITSILLSRYFGVDHKLTTIWSADLVGTGSILNSVFGKRFKLRRRPLGIVGSGLMVPPMSLNVPGFCRFHSVRGHLTEQLVSSKHDLSVGDPGLLISKLYPPMAESRSAKFKYGLIPHHSRYEACKTWLSAQQMTDACVIDLRTDDLDGVVNQMRSCEVIVSQALHGLIIADSLRLPNVWLDDVALHSGRRFKFYDYFSSIDRPFARVIQPDDLRSASHLEDKTFELNQKTLAGVQEDIDAAFRACFAGMGLESLRNASSRADA